MLIKRLSEYELYFLPGICLDPSVGRQLLNLGEILKSSKVINLLK